MNGGLTVARALAEARARGVAALDAQLLLGRLLGMTRTQLIARDDARIAADAGARWADWLARRSAGEPLAYLLGEKEFHGLLLHVTPDVLVPRPETELLVEWALECLQDRPGTSRVLDLGTGSGAIALAVALARPDADVIATDASAAALAVAMRNAERLAARVSFRQTSWWEGLDGQRFDVIASNPPYVRADDPALEALAHEPAMALTPGADDLAALRDIVEGAPAHLAGDGWLLLEHGFDQAPAVRSLLQGAGFDAVATRHDLAGHPRATGGRRPTGLP